MTKKELIAALANYPDDTVIYLATKDSRSNDTILDIGKIGKLYPNSNYRPEMITISQEQRSFNPHD